jgi:hypothetical protein
MPLHEVVHHMMRSTEYQHCDPKSRSHPLSCIKYRIRGPLEHANIYWITSYQIMYREFIETLKSVALEWNMIQNLTNVKVQNT